MLTLVSGASSLVVAPEFSAAVTGWMLGGTALLRRALPQATVGGDRHAMGCFPLLPYGNRIGHGRFRWRGVDYRLARNFGDSEHTIHGIGWQRAWSLAQTDAGSATLTLDHQPDNSWPFAFQASVDYSLSPAGLTVTIRLTSLHDAPAPAGIGLHPFFPKRHDPKLRFDASAVWENDDDCMPLRHGPVPEAWHHSDPWAIAQSRLDNCFTGWHGVADIDAGPASLRIEADAVFRNLQVFTPSWADFFCVEPVSHVPDALNRPDLAAEQAMQILAPGETLAGTVRLCLPVGSQ